MKAFRHISIRIRVGFTRSVISPRPAASTGGRGLTTRQRALIHVRSLYGPLSDARELFFKKPSASLEYLFKRTSKVPFPQPRYPTVLIPRLYSIPAVHCTPTIPNLLTLRTRRSSFILCRPCRLHIRSLELRAGAVDQTNFQRFF